MKHFLIITNKHKDTEHRVTGKISTYIEEKGGTCHCFFSSGDHVSKAAPKPSEIPPDTECVLVLGGDGTLIRAATMMVGSRIPLIGLNLGNLGYLCELEENNVFAAIDQLMGDEYVVENRMMLEGRAGKTEKEVYSGIALNDIVIYRTGALGVVRLRVYVNGEFLNSFRADGIIISTPTGSTGYNMSAGGPIVDPKAQMILITPINPHTLNSRSIVIGADAEIVIELEERRPERDEVVGVSFDGDHVTKLAVGDKFVIRAAKETAHICKLSKESFLEILSRKMQMFE